MLSLGFFARHKEDKNSVSPAIVARGSRRVLPRLLRWPARLINRLLAGNIAISGGGWLRIAGVGILVASTGVYATTKFGHSVVAEISANMGFTIEAVQIEGAHHLSRDIIISNLDLGRSKSLFTFDINHARKKLRELAWVKDVIVAKAYPDRLVVRVSERQPFAIWQKGKTLALIERGGISIENFAGRHSSLPLIVGKGANLHAAQIIHRVQNSDVLKDKVNAYIRVGNRRWDLRLNNGITLRLPDGGVAKALQKLSQLEREHALLSKDVSVIDLRLDDRLIVALGENALAARKARRPIGEKEKKI